MSGRTVTWEEAHRLLVEPGFPVMPYVWMSLTTGDTFAGQVKVVEQRGDTSRPWAGRWGLTVEDSRGILHRVDGALVARLQVYRPMRLFTGLVERRAARALRALDRPSSRPYVHPTPAGKWAVIHQRAPVGIMYDSLPDAHRVAAGCVA